MKTLFWCLMLIYLVAQAGFWLGKQSGWALTVMCAAWVAAATVLVLA